MSTSSSTAANVLVAYYAAVSAPASSERDAVRQRGYRRGLTAMRDGIDLAHERETYLQCSSGAPFAGELDITGVELYCAGYARYSGRTPYVDEHGRLALC